MKERVYGWTGRLTFGTAQGGAMHDISRHYIQNIHLSQSYEVIFPLTCDVTHYRTVARSRLEIVLLSYFQRSFSSRKETLVGLAQGLAQVLPKTYLWSSFAASSCSNTANLSGTSDETTQNYKESRKKLQLQSCSAVPRQWFAQNHDVVATKRAREHVFFAILGGTPRLLCWRHCCYVRNTPIVEGTFKLFKEMYCRE